MIRFIRSALLAVAVSSAAMVPLAACASASTGGKDGTYDPFAREEAVANAFVVAHEAPAIVWAQATDDHNADYVKRVSPDAEVIVLDRLNELLKQSPEGPLAMIAKTAGEHLIEFSAGEGGKTVDRNSPAVQTTAACISGLIVQGDLREQHVTVTQKDIDAMHQAVTVGARVADVPDIEQLFDLALAGKTDCQHSPTQDI